MTDDILRSRLLRMHDLYLRRHLAVPQDAALQWCEWYKELRLEADLLFCKQNPQLAEKVNECVSRIQLDKHRMKLLLEAVYELASKT